MDYRYSIYVLGLVANRIVPGVPTSPITSVDVRLSFGFLPTWLNELTPQQIETSYITEYTDASGQPALIVFKLLGRKHFRLCYSDQTEFVLDQTGSEICATLPDTLTL